MTFILSPISSSSEIWSVNHTSIYENSELSVSGNIKFLGEISTNWLKDLLGININKSFESCWWSLFTILPSTNTTSVISKWGTFLPFSS